MKLCSINSPGPRCQVHCRKETLSGIKIRGTDARGSFDWDTETALESGHQQVDTIHKMPVDVPDISNVADPSEETGVLGLNGTDKAICNRVSNRLFERGSLR